MAIRKVKTKKPVVISHGSRTEACIKAVKEAAEKNGIIINHPDHIAVASNKIRAKEMMVRLGVPTTNFQLATEDLRLEFPFVAKKIRGMGGEGMHLIKDRDDLDRFLSSNPQLNQYMYEEMFNPRKNLVNHIKTTREFRIHFSPELLGRRITYTDTLEDGTTVTETRNDGVIFMVKKVLRAEELNEETAVFGKNISTGNAYFTRNLGDFQREINEKTKLWEYIHTALCNLVRGLQLDYGAVDLLVCPSEKTFCFLEVNTAPGFGDGDGITAGRYTTALTHLIQFNQ